jgi:uncharacterized protein (TIGR02246 family)
MTSFRTSGPRRGSLGLGLAVALAVAGACSPAPPPDTRAEDEAAIRAAETSWSQAAGAKDLDRFVSYYAPDAVVLAPNAPMASDPAAIRKLIGELMAMPGFSISWGPTKVEVARSGDIGYAIGTYAMTMTGPDGKPMEDKGKYTTTWKKQADGSWKAVVDMFNTDMPLPPPPPPAPPEKK